MLLRNIATPHYVYAIGLKARNDIACWSMGALMKLFPASSTYESYISLKDLEWFKKYIRRSS